MQHHAFHGPVRCETCKEAVEMDQLIQEQFETHRLNFCSVRCSNEFFKAVRGAVASRSSQAAMY